MEKYITPAIEMLEFSDGDVITTSLIVEEEGTAGGGPEHEWPDDIQWGDKQNFL